MRKFLITVALATTTLAAVPAAAQYQGSRYDQRDDRRDDRRDHRNWNQNRHDGPSRQAVQNMLRELNQVEQRIQRSAQRRIISPREAVSLRREANRIRVQLHRSGRNGLTGREFAQLRVAINRLEQRLRVERRDRDGRRW